MGSYSFPSVNCDWIGITPNDLARPVRYGDLVNKGEKLEIDENLPVLLFAGEGAHQYFWSTAHGAYMSGVDQAWIILNYRK